MRIWRTYVCLRLARDEQNFLRAGSRTPYPPRNSSSFSLCGRCFPLPRSCCHAAGQNPQDKRSACQTRHHTTRYYCTDGDGYHVQGIFQHMYHIQQTRQNIYKSCRSLQERSGLTDLARKEMASKMASVRIKISPKHRIPSAGDRIYEFGDKFLV